LIDVLAIDQHAHWVTLGAGVAGGAFRGGALAVQDEIATDAGVLVQDTGFLAGRENDLTVVGPVIIENSAVVAVSHFGFEAELVDEFGAWLVNGGDRIEEFLLRKGPAIGLKGDGDGGADSFGCLEGVQCQADCCRVGWVLSQELHLCRIQVGETEGFVSVPQQQQRALFLDVDAVASHLAVVREARGTAEILLLGLVPEHTAEVLDAEGLPQCQCTCDVASWFVGVEVRVEIKPDIETRRVLNSPFF
jgi:hypothetical protein